jgi:hypothetical protein
MNQKLTIFTASTVALLGGVIYYFYSRNKIPFFPKRYTIGEVKQGRYKGEDDPKKVFIYLKKRQKMKNIAPQKVSAKSSDLYGKYSFRNDQTVLITGTGKFDGKYEQVSHWKDKDDKVAGVWIDVNENIAPKEGTMDYAGAKISFVGTNSPYSLTEGQKLFKDSKKEDE